MNSIEHDLFCVVEFDLRANASRGPRGEITSEPTIHMRDRRLTNLALVGPVSTERRKKAGKIVELGLIYLAKGGEIEVKPLLPGMTRPDVNRLERGKR